MLYKVPIGLSRQPNSSNKLKEYDEIINKRIKEEKKKIKSSMWEITSGLIGEAREVVEFEPVFPGTGTVVEEAIGHWEYQQID